MKFVDTQPSMLETMVRENMMQGKLTPIQTLNAVAATARVIVRAALNRGST